MWAVEVQSNSSWLWKYIMAQRPLVKDLIECDIGDGNKASYWFDNWTPLGPLIEYVGREGPRKLGIPLTATVAEGATPNQWRLPSARTRCQALLTVRRILSNLPTPSVSRGEDLFKWGPPNSRHPFFSTKKAWEHIRPKSNVKQWAKVVWFKGAVPKQAFTFWTANLNRLPVRDRLVSWGMNISSLCCLCNVQTETRDHLFLHCQYSDQVWDIILRRLGLPSLIFNEWGSFISWLSTVSSGTPTKLKLMVCQATIYSIWRERNNRLFNGHTTPISALFLQIDRSVRDMLLARRKRKGCLTLLSRWFAYS